MLWHKIQGAGGLVGAGGGGGGGGGGAITHVGSVTRNGVDTSIMDSAAEALDVLSIASTGDLVVIALSFDTGANSAFTWQGMSFTGVYNATQSNSPGSYVGYRFVQSGDSNPYFTFSSVGWWDGLSVVASVFSNVNSFLGSSGVNSSSGLPNPPSLTANGELWIATGHLDDDPITMTAPTDYTISGATFYSGSVDSATAIAYRIASLSSDDPSAFGGAGTDANRAVTLAFD